MKSYNNVTPMPGHDAMVRERAPVPNDLDAERAALGAVLLTVDAVHYALDHGLAEDAFYEPGHRAAWRAIRAALDQRPESLNADLVGNKAGLDGVLDAITTTDEHGHRVVGRKALARFTATGSTLNYRTDIDTAVEYARRRRTMERAHNVYETARDGGELGAALASLADLADTSSTAERLRRELLVGRAIYDVAPLEPLIDGLLDLDTLAAIYGEAGSYKSFLALDLALRVARGEWWNAREVKEPRPVLYVVAEGVHGMADRVKAWYHAHTAWGGVENTPPDELVWLPEAVNLLDLEHADALGRLARDLGAGLVVVDTLNRCSPGADENSSRDMGAAIAGLDRVRKLTGATVLAVHHTGKDPTKGLRGHSSLIAALDTALEVRAAENVLTLTAEKQKYREGGIVGRFAVKPAGDSLVLEAGATAPVATEWLIDPLRELDAGDGVTGPLITEATGKSRATVFKALRVALEQGAVVKIGRGRYAVAE